MNIHSFPGCCAFQIITGFPGSGTAGPGTLSDLTDADITTYLKNVIVVYGGSGAGLIITLDQNQRLRFHDLVGELGFKPAIDNTFNSNHFSLVTVYFREGHPKTDAQKVEETKDLGKTSGFFKQHAGAKERFFGAA